jgi:hypothetical protein
LYRILKLQGTIIMGCVVGTKNYSA